MSLPEALSREDIMRRLWNNFQAQKPVVLLNMFRGLPVSHEATLALISQKYAAVMVNGLQATCIRWSGVRFTERVPPRYRSGPFRSR